jgi:MFS family permease
MDRQRWINLFAAISAVTVFGFALGLVFPLLSLVMEKHGVPPQVIGFNTAMQPLGILVSGFLVPHLTSRLGTRPVAIIAAFLTAAIIVAYPFTPIYWAWFVLRFLHGLAVGALFTVSEAWVVEAAFGPARSRIMALYASILSVSFGLGPALISFTGIETVLPFLIGAGFLAASTIPMFYYRSIGTLVPETGERQLSILGFARLAPILISAVTLFAVIDAAYLGLMPVYGVKKGFDQEAAALMLTAFIVGNAALQFPIGWIADHWSKRGMMAVCAFTTVIGSALIPSAFGTWMLWPVLVVTGATSAGIYTMALAELGDRFSGNELVAGTAAFSTTWGGGALVGALIGGWAMDRFGPDGLPYATAVVFAAFVVAIAARTASARRT